MQQHALLTDHGPVAICHPSEVGQFIIWTRSSGQYMEIGTPHSDFPVCD
jgi:hypothetical protein